MRPSIYVFLGLADFAFPCLPAFAVETPAANSAASHAGSGPFRHAPISREVSSGGFAAEAEGRRQKQFSSVSSEETSKEASENVSCEPVLPPSHREPKVPYLPEVLLARRKLTPEEFAEAEKEAFEEVLRLSGFNTTTTTTTTAPGFFMEVLTGLKNAVTAPFRTAKTLFTHPSELWTADVGSAMLASEKLDSAIAGEEGGVKDLAREWWRIVTMDPERQKEAKEKYIKSLLEGDKLGDMIFESDDEQSATFGEYLQKAQEAEEEARRLREEEMTEEELQEEFSRTMLEQD